MTPIHKVQSWSLGGQGVILTGAGMFRTPVFIVLSRSHSQKSVCICLGSGSHPEKFSGGGGGGDTVKITSAPGPDQLILNWNRMEWLKIDLEWTRNGPGLDLDLSLTINNLSQWRYQVTTCHDTQTHPLIFKDGSGIWSSESLKWYHAVLSFSYKITFFTSMLMIQSYVCILLFLYQWPKFFA